jgi:hypothetical protein
LQKGVFVNIFEIVIFLFIIVQQPPKDSLWVSSQTDAVTHWEYVEQYGAYGLLAHDYLAGDYFYHLRQGDELYADGYNYTVTDIRYYDGSVTDEVIFNEVYITPDRLVLQTCWGDGYMFIIGEHTGEYNAIYDDELAFVKDADWSMMFEFMMEE